MAIAERRMTLEEFERLPEEKPALELRHGLVTQKVSPVFYHGRLQSKFGQRINDFAEPRRLGMAVTEVRMTTPRGSVVPDVSVFRWERLPRDARGRLGRRRFREPPDIAIEILSPDDRRADSLDKCRWMVANGVSIVLLVDADREVIVEVRPGPVARELRRGDLVDLSDVLPGLRIEVAEVFGWLD